MSNRNTVIPALQLKKWDYSIDWVKDEEVDSKTNYQCFNIKLEEGIGWSSAKFHLVLLNTFFNDLDEKI